MKATGLAGAAAVAPAAVAADRSGGAPAQTQTLSLDGRWQFRLDGSREWTEVEVPHTWNIDPEHSASWGVARYRLEFDAPAEWAGQWVLLEFESVYHTAEVRLNGQIVGTHERMGYTAFAFDVSPLLKYGEPNVLEVKADNTFRDDMLPRERSYDWVADGGITRPVNLHVTPRTFVQGVVVDSDFDPEKDVAELRVRADVRNMTGAAVEVRLGCSVYEDETGPRVAEFAGTAAVRLDPGQARWVDLPAGRLAKPRRWHFDHPHLYRLVTTLHVDGKPVHARAETFGLRKIEVRNNGFWLNGERVELMGVERMGGSNPEYGMAEPESWLIHDHDDMKQLNCIYTRVHWQQDRRMLDYCDRHGILLQTEVPSWGPRTFQDLTPEAEAAIQENGLEQLREMIARERNHPCIFSWGLCNEVDGQNPAAQRFVRRMAQEARKLDPGRLLTYASNSLQRGDIASDVAGELDYIMWNEYYESWMGQDVAAMEANLKRIHEAFPKLPVVISEYGYCECRPEHDGGDEKRIDVLRNHDQVFRRYDWVAGLIFFDYNDYRTHIGDKGIGPLKQRVHGVVDLYGNRKPSWDDLRAESSPVEKLEATVSGSEIRVTVSTRRRLPAYTLRGYGLRWIVFGFGGLPMEAGEIPLPDLAPGVSQTVAARFTEKTGRRIQLDVMRPTRFSAATKTIDA
jgi:beta-glucuronidase